MDRHVRCVVFVVCALVLTFLLRTLEWDNMILQGSQGNRFCPSLQALKMNLSLTSGYKSSVLPNGYNVGDILNMPSFNTLYSWPAKGNGYTDTVSVNLAQNLEKSVLGLYFIGQNHSDKKHERSPSLPRLKLAVDFYGAWVMDTSVKDFCDILLTKTSTILVHLRSCDSTQVSTSYVQSIYKVSKEFDTIVLTGGCHEDKRYATHAEATSRLISAIDLVYNHMRDNGVACKLRVLHSNNADDSLYAFRVAANVMVEKGGFGAVGSLISRGNVYLDPEMAGYYNNIDFRHFISNAKLLWKHDQPNEYKSVFDKIAHVVPTNCLFETFGSGDESKRICMTPSIHGESCWILSIGCNGLFGFETDIFFRTACMVHIFDCTGDWEVPKNISSRVFLHKVCVGPKELSDTNRTFLPYEDIVSSVTNNATNKVSTKRPLYLKMDVEGFEFQVLPAILELPLADQPAQIGFELHLITFLNAGPAFAQPSKGTMWFIKDKSDVGLLFYKLEAIGGYKLISRNDNPFCPSCTELVIMKL